MDALQTNIMSAGPSSLFCPACLARVVSCPERRLDWVDTSRRRRTWHSMYSVHHLCPVCGKDLGMFYLPKKASEWVLYGLYGPLTNKKTSVVKN
jgi:hypothetical protein